MLGRVRLPAMLQSARRDQTTPHETQAAPAWAGLDDPNDVWVDVPDGGHLSFITVCYDLTTSLLEAFQPDATEDGCGPTFTPAEELVPVLGGYLLAFGRQHVLGEPRWAELIAGEPFAPAVEITIR